MYASHIFHTADNAFGSSALRGLARVLGVPAAYFYAEDTHLAELIILFGQLKAMERKMLFGFAESLVSAAGK
jgi:hypothetical protein